MGNYHYFSCKLWAIIYPGAVNEVSITSGAGLCAYQVGTNNSRGLYAAGSQLLQLQTVHRQAPRIMVQWIWPEMYLSSVLEV